MKLKLSPEKVLRLSLGAVYLYSSYGLISRPEDWYGFAPQWLSDFISKIIPFTAYLRIQGSIELIFAIVFLGWFFRKKTVRIFVFLAAMEMLGILLFAGVDLVTFRDIGLLGALISLWLLLKS